MLVPKSRIKAAVYYSHHIFLNYFISYYILNFSSCDCSTIFFINDFFPKKSQNLSAKMILQRIYHFINCCSNVSPKATQELTTTKF